MLGPDAVTTPAPERFTAQELSDQPNPYHEVALQTYVVQAGDTLWDVALEAGWDVASVPCAIAPTFQITQPLVIGDTLTFPAPDHYCHQVGPDETLATIATLYRTTPATIVAEPWNQLPIGIDGQRLPEGYYLRIPIQKLAGNAFTSSPPPQPTDGETEDFLNWMLDQPLDTSPFMALAVGGPFATRGQSTHDEPQRATIAANQPGAVPEYWPYGSGTFRWPLAGWLTQGYRYDHRAIDVAAPLGTAVTAADRGVVIRAGWNNQGYGQYVVIDHNIDYITLYAHMSEVLVAEGDVVAQGQLIGRVGSTGNSTGPHLHFEIRDFGRLTNPLELLVQ